MKKIKILEFQAKDLIKAIDFMVLYHKNKILKKRLKEFKEELKMEFKYL